MQVSSVPRAPTIRPQVKRMSQRELQETQISNEFDSPSIATANRWQNRRQSQIAPEMYAPWRPAEGPPRNYPNDNDKSRCFLSRGWLWLFGGIFCLILLVAIVAVVLGVVLPMTTTTAPDGSVTSKMVYVNFGSSAVITCSSTNRGSIERLNGLTSLGWTSYSYNYTATTTTPTLLFGFETDSIHSFYLDDVSVVDYITPSIELLSNPSFESSTVNATDWIKSCDTTCTNQIVSGSQCFGSSGNCLIINCPVDNSSISFLSQSFTATVGNTYKISFMLNHNGNFTTGIMNFYLDVI